jgi:hypothetical protein
MWTDIYVTTQKTEDKTIHEWRQNVSISELLTQQGTRDDWTQTEKTQSSASFGQGDEAHRFSSVVHAKNRSIAAGPEWQSHVPNIGADGAASFHEIRRLVTPGQLRSYRGLETRNMYECFYLQFILLLLLLLWFFFSTKNGIHEHLNFF